MAVVGDKRPDRNEFTRLTLGDCIVVSECFLMQIISMVAKASSFWRTFLPRPVVRIPELFWEAVKPLRPRLKREVNMAAAWAVRFCARDLFDIPTSLIAQRVIAAYLDGNILARKI
jgi:hypothetical protein